MDKSILIRIISFLNLKKESFISEIKTNKRTDFKNDTGSKIIAVNELLGYFADLIEHYADDSYLELLKNDLEYRVQSLLLRQELATQIANREFARLVIQILEKYNPEYFIPDYVKKPLTTTSNL